MKPWFVLPLLLALPVMAQPTQLTPDPRQPAVQPQPEPADRTERIDSLLDRLALTDDPREAKAVEVLVWKYWSDSGSPTVNLLLEHSTTAMSDEDTAKARKLLDAAIEIEPDFAEAWNKRATLLFMQGNYASSLEDIAKTLSLEPRHFGALAGRGMIYEQRNKKDLALESYRRVLAIYPAMPGMKERVKKLAIEVEGLKI